MKNNAYSYPAFVVTGGLATSGHVTDLAPGQVGIFYREPSQNVATSPKERDELFLAIGSVRKFDKIGQMAGYKQPTESAYFRVKDIESFEVSNPSKELKSNIISVGYSGGSCSEGIKFQCDTSYVFTITITGSPVLREFGKPLIKTLSYHTGCCPGDGCTTCEETLLDCETHTKAIVELINNEVELTQAGLKSRYVSNTYVAPTPNKTKYALSVCDDGDQNALNAVQAKVGNLGVIYRKSRKDCKSEYEYCGDSAAADFTPSQSVALAVCGACEAGYTLSPAARVFTVVRPLAGTENLVGDVAKQTFADTIGTAYEATGVLTFDGATAVDPVTNRITVTAHGLNLNAPVLYADGGGTQVVGLTDATVYFVKSIVDANTITLSATAGGAVIDITADGVGAAHTLTPQITATFLSTNGATASVQLSIPRSTAIVALLSDTVVESFATEAICTPTVAATPIAWTVSGTAYKVKRKLKITLQRQDCAGGDRLAELTAYYSTHPEVVANSIVKLGGSVGCEDCYEIEQWSKGCMADECLATDSANFNEFGSFLGQLWEVVPVVPAVDLTRKCGFTLQAHIDEQTLSNCAFSKDDFYETEPIHLEFSWEVNYPDVCSADLLPKIKNKGGEKYLRQTGEAVVRMLIESGAYDWACGYSDEPIMRERLGQELLNQVDRKAFYKIYYIKFTEARAGVNTFAEQPRKFEPILIVKETDPVSSTIEKSFGKLAAVAGVSLSDRSDIKW